MIICRVLVGLAICLWAGVPSFAADRLEGRASVVDGDTIEIHGERVRFNGVDAPESQQLCQDAKAKSYRCGQIAAKALDQFLSQSRPTRCNFVERDQYGRFVGDCYRADGKSVSSWLVRNGYALDWPRYSNGAYASDQAVAKSKRLGIWAGPFQPPWEWRAAQKQVSSPTVPAASAPSASGCKIKGNVSRKGDRIYHVPGQKYYAKTRITESKGERWFCTEGEARTAGWRRSKT